MRTSDNAQNLPPVPSARVSRLRIMGGVFLLPIIFFTTIVCAIWLTQYLYCVFSERVYEADAHHVNPALEGKLVSVYVDKIEVPRGQGAGDADFGIQDAGIAVFRSFLPIKEHGRIKVHYNNLHGVSDLVNIAPCVCAGGYELLADPSFWRYEPVFSPEKIILPPQRVPESLAPFVEKICGSRVLLKTADTGPAASRFYSLFFEGLPHVVRGEFILIGRQRGTQLDMREPGCGLCKDPFPQWHTHRYVVSSILLPWHIESPLIILMCVVVLFYSWSFILHTFKWGKRAGVHLPIACVFVPVLCGSFALLFLYKLLAIHVGYHFENVPLPVLILLGTFIVFFFVLGLLSLLKKSPDARHDASGE